VEALEPVAAESGEHVLLRRVLDAFGDDFQVEGMAEVDHATDERQSGLVAGLRDQGPVDLDAVERQTSQVGERRVSGAEVVEAEMDPEGAQLAEQLDGAIPWAIRAVSVSSSSSSAAGSAARRSAAATTAGSRPSRSWWAETLIETRRGVPAAAQAAAWVQARSMTHSPMSPIRPRSSASGMNTSGGTVSVPPGSQRIRASTLRDVPVRVSSCSW
jgi:hypothetical protein